MNGGRLGLPPFFYKMAYEKETTVKTEFNASLAKLQRIDKLRQEIHKARAAKDFEVWFDCLVGIADEIWEKLDKAEREEITDMNNIFESRNSWYRDKNRTNQKKGLSMRYYFALTDYSRRLSELENKYGMSITDQEDDAMGDGDW